MIIRKLDREEYRGRKYHAEILSDRYLSIEPEGDGFDVRWVTSGEPLRMTIDDVILADWLEDSAAYGAFEGDRLVGFAEGFLEKWNNRYRISNICVFENADRRSGTGTKLMESILEEAARSGARMAVLETQSFNFKAISFYKKHGFQIIGFDRYAYSNRGPEEHNMLIEMGLKLQD
jgi:ribosomal protein S18 acetylase RimI-like enzyme